MRKSPIDAWLAARQPEWMQVGGMRVARCFGDAPAEKEALGTLALCDLSFLAKLGVKGKDSAGWLQDEDVEIPPGIYETRRLADGGFVVRLASDEFLLESGVSNECVPALLAQSDSIPGQAYVLARQEATLLLTGCRATEVLAQTCGVNFKEAPPHRLVMTRVAGTSCSVLPDPLDEVWACRLWVDCSFALYLWEQLVQISESLGGTVVGAACVYDLLASAESGDGSGDSQ